MQWCNKCHYGPYRVKIIRCTMCGGTEFTDSKPHPQKPVRSIRAMDKRINTQKETKSERDPTIEKITKGDLKGRDYVEILNK